MYDPQRVIAFHVNSMGLWELKKTFEKELYILELNGGPWVITQKASVAFDAFNNLKER